VSRDPAIDAARVIADLRELDRRTGGAEGARRVAWTETWREARAFLGELLAEVGLEAERDEAGNLWIWMDAGADAPALALGSHLDSVPSGGWLDGALGVMGALGVVRGWATAGEPPPRPLALVDWADEEGRFGRSLLGSSAFAGTLDPDQVRELRDGGGTRLADALTENGIDLDRAPQASRRRERIGAYLELHIEQGPVLEAEGLPAAAVAGCVGIERWRLRFRGEAAHAGTTPMDRRRDAGLAAAAAALRIERVAREHGGVATTGALTLRPGIATAVPAEAELLSDLRHPDAAELAAMLRDAIAAGEEQAAERGCELDVEPVWRIEPIGFDERLVELVRECCLEVAGADRVLVSGALHDAAEAARVVPAAMLFTSSVAGISHSPREDTSEPDLTAAIEAFGAAANRALRS
jgi:hydantoinase/carbamoylase family amidase